MIIVLGTTLAGTKPVCIFSVAYSLKSGLMLSPSFLLCRQMCHMLTGAIEVSTWSLVKHDKPTGWRIVSLSCHISIIKLLKICHNAVNYIVKSSLLGSRASKDEKIQGLSPRDLVSDRGGKTVNMSLRLSTRSDAFEELQHSIGAWRRAKHWHSWEQMHTVWKQNPRTSKNRALFEFWDWIEQILMSLSSKQKIWVGSSLLFFREPSLRCLVRKMWLCFENSNVLDSLWSEFVYLLYGVNAGGSHRFLFQNGEEIF